MHAAIYARYSTDLQSKASIEDQVHACRKLIKGRGFGEGPVFTDVAISGTTQHRSGYQQMLQDAENRTFEVLVAESLDRLSRDQEHVASLFKRMSYWGIPIITVAEGEISEMHIGLKGTMGALYIKDLAQKTRRGLEGRVRAGKSGGGNCYGYRVVRQIDERGEYITGERQIVPEQAEVVRRIFRDYLAGQSSRQIAAQLNRESIPGPRGKTWGMSTIHGNDKRGTGILNNELYLGRLVWNRQHFVKDPDTGKRQARFNPNDEVVVTNVPALRIVEDELWQEVKARQEGRRHDMQAEDGRTRPERARRPRYLFSGLLKCGCCGASYTLVDATHYGCAGRRNKGTCDNRLTIAREEVEERILTGLKDHMLDPDLIGEFVAEYQREYARLMQSDRAQRTRLERELAEVTRDLDRVVEAIVSGYRNDTIKAKLDALELRKASLEAEISSLGAEEPIRLHPGLSDVYRRKVANLTAALNDDATRSEATELLRGLFQEVRLIPEDDGHAIELVGELAAIMSLGDAKNQKARSSATGIQRTVVAGTGFEPVTFRL